MSERIPPAPFKTWGELRRRAWAMSVPAPEATPAPVKKAARVPTVYFFRKTNSIKIGFSTNWRKRLRQLQTAEPEPIVPLRVLHGSKRSERELHSRFSCDRISIRHEWFRASDDLVQFIAANAAECLMKGDDGEAK